MSNNHIPVMLNEVKSFIPKTKKLNLIDATFGGGGYSKVILEEFKIKNLIAIDRDPISKIFYKELNKNHKNIDFFNFDCCSLEKMNEVMKDVDVVYHCAATAHEGLSVFSPVEITKNNYLASVSVFTSAVANKVKRIIFCSSMARYGDQKTPFTEDMIPKPIDPYAISKVAAENVLINLCELNNIEWVIAVPHNIIGPRQKYDDPFRNVVSIMINRMLQNKAPLIYGEGKQKRCFSYIDDLSLIHI